MEEYKDFMKLAIETKQVLQPSNDTVKFLLDLYKEQSGKEAGCCSDCILEAFQWLLDNE